MHVLFKKGPIVVPKRQQQSTDLQCEKFQKSEDFIYTAAET